MLRPSTAIPFAAASGIGRRGRERAAEDRRHDPSHPERKLLVVRTDRSMAGRAFCRRIAQLARWATVFGLAFAASCDLAAFDGDRSIAAFFHTGWAVADGAPSGVHGFAQTADGYLWLASTNGLFRFDGVHFARYEPASGGSLQFRDVSALLPTPDGGLWIGRAGGASFLKNDRAVTYGRSDGLPTATVFRFAMDRQAVVWAATSRGLFRFDHVRWELIGAEWKFSAQSATDVFLDSRGQLWVTAPDALFSLAADARAFTMRRAPGPWRIREAPDHILWMSEDGAGIRAVDGSLAQFSDSSRTVVTSGGGPQEFLVDRDGAIWFASQGIARLERPGTRTARQLDAASRSVDRFTQNDGLTGDTVVATLEDREGNIWAATTAGVDRFRRRNVMPGPFPSGRETLALATDGHGRVLAAGHESVMQSQDGGVSVRATIHMPAGYQFTRASVRCVYRDADDTLWLGGLGVLTRVTGNIAREIELPSEVAPDGQWDILAVTRDHHGDLWVSIQQHGVFILHQGGWRQFGQQEGLEVDRTPETLWTDARGRVWFGYVGSKITALDGQALKTYSVDGLGIGNVTFIGGNGDRLWVVGPLGFALFDGTSFRTIAGAADTRFRGISGVVETANGDFWIHETVGLAHISASEVQNRIRDTGHTLRYELFDFRDGVPSSATTSEPTPSAVLGGDGRIWMSGSNGTYWIDPARIFRNPLQPPVAIEAVYADDRRYDASDTSRLPVSPSNVRIEYTALSLSIPERVRFRYQLEGVDKDWQDAGTRRAAYYTKLPPGRFRFHVIASNNDGVWNETGAVASIVVPPAYFQTMWFLALCVCTGCGLLWIAYVVRLRQVSAQIRGRLEERVAERTRIARELHDTLLQSFQGLMLRLQVVDDILPEGQAKHQLEQALERADQAIAEGRNAVYDLRRSATDANDLAQAVKALGEELATEHSATFRLLVEGASRDLNPILRDEVYRITREALRNAFGTPMPRRSRRKSHTETGHSASAFATTVR